MGRPCRGAPADAPQRAGSNFRREIRSRRPAHRHGGWLELGADGTCLATASFDGTAKVTELSTGNTLFTLFGHAGWVYSVGFSPDGRRLATSGLDGTTRVWDAGPSREVLAFAGPTGPQSRVAFSPDGLRAVSANADKTARIWDSTTARQLLMLNGRTDVVYSEAFSPDGRRVVTGGEDNTARVWDAATGEEQLTLIGHGEGIVGSLFRGIQSRRRPHRHRGGGQDSADLECQLRRAGGCTRGPFSRANVAGVQSGWATSGQRWRRQHRPYLGFRKRTGVVGAACAYSARLVG